MKRLFNHDLSAVLAIMFVAIMVAVAGCASTTSTDPRQQAVDATYKSAVTLDAAITATRGAVRSGALKGQDAQNALKAFEMSMTSLKAAQAALAAQPATPASGAK